MQEFEKALNLSTAAVEQKLDQLLPVPQDAESRLHEAMRYAVLGGGKRLRPFLLLNSAALFAVNTDCALRVAAAIECIHCYSLVHDDLPCMDDDDMRRGRPSTHKQFDEATAVLAGDALLTLAFDILSRPETHEDPHVRCELVAMFAEAAGARGMVGGQMIDLLAENQNLPVGAIARMQQMKTGALISLACDAGATLGRASPPHRQALHAYAFDLGLAFQIADDLLDSEGETAQIGKTPGKDQAAGKSTFVASMGPERARTQAQFLSGQAVKHLDLFDKKADLLRQAAGYIVNRQA